MRRDENDIEWQALKERIFKRDKSCRLIKSLTYKENLMLSTLANKRKEFNLLTIIDPAHIYPVSLYPHLIYEDLNVILLNRFAHNMLEKHTCPLTGKTLNKEEYELFFIKILGDYKFSFLKTWAKHPELYKIYKEKINE